MAQDMSDRVNHCKWERFTSLQGWKFFLLGAAAGGAVAIRRKTLIPFYAMGVIGIAMDQYEESSVCSVETLASKPLPSVEDSNAEGF